MLHAIRASLLARAVASLLRCSRGAAFRSHAPRAAFSSNLTGANLPEEILYPNTRGDEKGAPLSGKNTYVLHFEKDETPPVSVFWNMSMNDDKEFFIENDFKRYSIGSTTDGLKKGADGFNLTMRLYGSQTPILNGSYRLPAVRKAN